MTFWANQKVVVTGCSGLMGGHLCKLLLEEGAYLTGYDLTGEGTLSSHGLAGQFPVIQEDIRNRETLYRAIRRHGVVFHLAAVSGVEASKQNPKRAWTVNVSGTGVVLDTCKAAGIDGAVVVASSNHIYGFQEALPVPETAQLNQLDTYSATKIAVDYMARSYAHNYRVPTVIMRNTNCFGPHDPHRDHIVGGTLYALVQGQRPVIRGTGKTSKSYLHVADVARAYMAAAEWEAETGRCGEVFNVSDKPISVRDFVDLMCQATGHADLLPIVLGQGNDQNNEWMDDTKLRTLTTWRPRYSLESAIQETYRWVVLSQEMLTRESASLFSAQGLRSKIAS